MTNFAFLTLIIVFLGAIFPNTQGIAQKASSPNRVETTDETINFPSRDGTRLFGRFYKHPKPKGLVVVVHGLQNHTEWYRNGDRFAEAGFSTLLFDRRGSGHSDGKKGHLQSPGQWIEDLEAAIQYARSRAPDVPFHLMANEMGFYAAFAYAKMKPKSVQSLIFVTPSAAILPSADHPTSLKAKIYVSPSYRYFETPLDDKDFVSSGEGYDWIRNDRLGQREFTASFLRAINSLRADTTKFEKSDLQIPLLLVLASKDRIIDNARAKSGFYDNYPGPKILLEIDTEHFIGLTPESEIMNQALLDWLKGGYRNVPKNQPPKD
jgi:alpha-beta hydrolase superfamily lysophospholipase